jgi:site-specific DNA-methyltransferase (adenine-specific)
VTSPPYDNLRTYGGVGDGWNFETFKAVAKEMARILKQGGLIVWNVADATIDYSETGTSFRQALYFKDECGLNLFDTMIWLKPTFTDTASLKYRYGNVFEYMFVISKGKPTTFNPIKDRKNAEAGRLHRASTVRQADGTMKMQYADCLIPEYSARFNVWRMNTESIDGHPAPFPVELPRAHIISWSNRDDIVLDPFMGSGTTAIACIKEHRHFIGFELNKEYFDKAVRRIKAEQAQLTLF